MNEPAAGQARCVIYDHRLMDWTVDCWSWYGIDLAMWGCGEQMDMLPCPPPGAEIITESDLLIHKEGVRASRALG